MYYASAKSLSVAVSPIIVYYSVYRVYTVCKKFCVHAYVCKESTLVYVVFTAYSIMFTLRCQEYPRK